MKSFFSAYLLTSGAITLAAGVLHILIIFGGPSWYSRFGAPDSIVRMVQSGHYYPIIFCLMTASFLFSCSLFAFSGAGIIHRLPFLKVSLILCGTIFSLRGVSFIPLMIARPDLMANFCNSKGVDSFLLISSCVCLVAGGGFILGAINA